MPPAAKAPAKKAAPKEPAKAAEKKEGPGRGRKVEIAKKATFGVNHHKDPQYVRLVVFNHGQKVGIIPKSEEINDVSNALLEKAGLDLVGGNLLNGPEGVEYIKKMTAKGSTTGRPLTDAFATEVRPWIRRLEFADFFGNRRAHTTAARKAEEAAAAEKADAKKAAKKEEGTPDTQAEASAQS